MCELGLNTRDNRRNLGFLLEEIYSCVVCDMPYNAANI